MHAVVVRVTVNDLDNAQELQNRVVPNVSQSAGFIAGYRTRSGNEGLSIVIFDSEENARAMADRVTQTVPAFMIFQDPEVREVVASA